MVSIDRGHESSNRKLIENTKQKGNLKVKIEIGKSKLWTARTLSLS